MITLALVMTRAGGRGRMLLIGASTAIVSGVLLAAVAILSLRGDSHERLLTMVSDDGNRYGAVLGIVLLTLPPLLFLHQALRLGTAARERRLVALRLAGATPRDVRLLGAVEVALPAGVGSVLGIGVFAFLRWALGPGRSYVSDESVQPLGLIPAAWPAWWQIVLVIVAVTSLGVIIGSRASSQLVVTPLGVARRQARPAPRPWGLLLFAAVGVILAASARVDISNSQVFAIPVVLLCVLAIISLVPWLAHRVGLRAQRRATDATTLLAARRLVANPRPIGRASGAVGAIGLIAGGCAVLLADVFISSEYIDGELLVSLGLVGFGLLISLGVVIGTIAIHLAETLLDRKRSNAALMAMGLTAEELARSQRQEARLVTLPAAAVGYLVATAGYGSMLTWSSAALALVVIVGALTLGMVWVAIAIATRLTRPWLLQATALTNLRTE